MPKTNKRTKFSSNEVQRQIIFAFEESESFELDCKITDHALTILLKNGKEKLFVIGSTFLRHIVERIADQKYGNIGSFPAHCAPSQL